MRRAGTKMRTPSRASPASRESRASREELEVRTEDGVALRAVVNDPPPDVERLGTLVLAHAMFARKTEFGRPDKPGIADVWAARGYRTVAFDFRGHGESRVTRPWSYDDLVRFDLPAVVGCARDRSEGEPVLVVGHSLGGHAALASQATGRMQADGIVSIAGNVWLRALEPSRFLWAAKVVTARAMLAVVARAGRFPARALRLGSDDEAAPYLHDIVRGVFEGTWRSADGRDDYLARLADVSVPVCSIASDGDRLNCRPTCAEAFVRRCGGPLEVIRVRRADGGGPPPDHMGLVTTDGARSALLGGVDWVRRNARSYARP